MSRHQKSFAKHFATSHTLFNTMKKENEALLETQLLMMIMILLQVIVKF
jgi:hypothetical protein